MSLEPNTIGLNGFDLAGLDDNSVDMVAAYSVLHHIPVYLSAISEFARVVRPGGVIYIDHEMAPHYWETHSAAYSEYREALGRLNALPLATRVINKLLLLKSLKAWKRMINRTLWGLNDQGDIHVTLADHIEWQHIDNVLAKHCEVVLQTDYLVCRELKPDAPLYQKCRDSCSDMRMGIYRKRQPQ
ncbi:MAG: methyltransferase domain-containing protein [Devosia sp.]|nr:methyltransferase domain-containing protein [Devosia sp.]